MSKIYINSYSIHINTYDMKHLTFMCFLLCLFACSSEDIVSTVEESAKPANELTAQTVNLLDSLEIMEYIDSIISSFPKTRDHVTGYLLKMDGTIN